MDNLDALTVLIALSGAIVAIILVVRKIRKHRRRIRITCKILLDSSPNGDLWEFIAIQAINIGQRPLEITLAGLMMSNGDIFIKPSYHVEPLTIPKKLENGESILILFDFPEIVRVARERSQSKIIFTKTFVKDTEGNIYMSSLPKIMKDISLSR